MVGIFFLNFVKEHIFKQDSGDEGVNVVVALFLEGHTLWHMRKRVKL